MKSPAQVTPEAVVAAWRAGSSLDGAANPVGGRFALGVPSTRSMRQLTKTCTTACCDPTFMPTAE
ncbi:DUF6229 family protein [Catellatospora sp. NPDC049609]|uniref:DUF6229 family protein n=1 Tax=Catellatospora sp. NPDC049609 TaxID=3155505 RepID=UPI003429AFF5